MQNLLDIIGREPAEHEHFCGVYFQVWEKYVAVPALKAKGFEVIQDFYSEQWVKVEGVLRPTARVCVVRNKLNQRQRLELRYDGFSC